MDRADANNGRSQLDLEHRSVHVAQPLWLIRVIFQAHATDKSLVATHNHHDQQVGNHHHVDQRQHHQHDDRLIERDDGGGGFVTNAGDQGLQGGLAAKSGFQQVDQFNPKMEDVDRLRGNQAQIQGHLQPAAGKNES